MKTAIVHDYLNQYGGAERVLESLHEIFPEAPVFTILYDREALPQFGDWDIRPSFVQRVPFARRNHRNFIFLFPGAVRSFDLRGFDLVISNTHAWSKGIMIDRPAFHISYCLTPLRYIWDLYDDYLSRSYIPFFARAMLPGWAGKMRAWDIRASGSVDRFAAVSGTVAGRIRDYYGRESSIIYPPCDTDLFRPAGDPGGTAGYYLTVARLKAYKRIDVVVDAFNRLGRPLKIIGEGPESGRLRKMARGNIELLGRVPDEELVRNYQNCRGFVYAGVEDFGLVFAEAQACGRPVIAYGKGGAAEIILDGRTGVLFDEPSAEALVSAVKRSELISFDSTFIRERSLRFGKDKFRKNFCEFVSTVTQRQPGPAAQE
ncbi:MAG: glycosyltransferase [Candidatus Omnitrophota bacterium]